MRAFMIASALLTAAVASSFDAHASLWSKTYNFKPGVTLEVGAETDSGLRLESVRFDSVDLAAFDAPPRGPTLTLATDAIVNDTPSIDVLSAVQADVAEGTRSQFRLRFTESVSADGGPDLFASNWPTLQLRVGYLLP